MIEPADYVKITRRIIKLAHSLSNLADATHPYAQINKELIEQEILELAEHVKLMSLKELLDIVADYKDRLEKIALDEPITNRSCVISRLKDEAYCMYFLTSLIEDKANAPNNKD
jgi:replicative DNA helicase